MKNKHKKQCDEAKHGKEDQSSENNIRIDGYLRPVSGVWDQALRWLVMTNQPLLAAGDLYHHKMILSAPNLKMIGRKVRAGLVSSTHPRIFYFSNLLYEAIEPLYREDFCFDFVDLT